VGHGKNLDIWYPKPAIFSLGKKGEGRFSEIPHPLNLEGKKSGKTVQTVLFIKFSLVVSTALSPT
jgi:hypothetical protein